jgi:hypothetical protein
VRTISVVPAPALSGVLRLLAAAGWQGEAVTSGWGDDPRSAGRLAGTSRPVLFVPRPASVPRDLRRIVVVHGGSRGEMAGVEAADEASLATAAEIVVLYVPSAAHPVDAASLPFRLGDHPEHDWAEWREEFMRRFCRCSEGVAVSLRVAMGSPAASVPFTSGDVRADLVIATGDGGSDPTRAETLDAILVASSCPVLIVSPA